MYETLILIGKETSLPEGAILSSITNVFENQPNAPTLESSGRSIKIRWPNYIIELYHSKEEHVVDESQDLSAQFASDHPLTGSIAACSERVEISGDHDPDMSHFNDYCFIVESIEKLGKMYTFDSAAGEFMNM